MSEYLKNATSIVSSTIVQNRPGSMEPWQISAHRWALCYLLSTDPRYSGRFRKFGLEVLSGSKVDFNERFPELGFHLDADYRRFVEPFSVDRGAVVSAVAQ
jgi:hypothetical protein